MIFYQKGIIIGPFTEILDYFFQNYAEEIVETGQRRFNPRQNYDQDTYRLLRKQKLNALLEKIKKESEFNELSEGCLYQV